MKSIIIRLPGITANGLRPLIKPPPPPALWTPAQITNLRGWWVPDTLAGDVDPGVEVGSLPSSGGVTNTLANAVIGKYPLFASLGGKGALSFDGVDDELRMSDLTVTNAATAVTVFFLFKFDSIPTDAGLKTLLQLPGPTLSVTRFYVGLENAASATKRWCVTYRNNDADTTKFVYSTAVGDLDTHLMVVTFNRTVSPTHIEMWMDGVRIINHDTAYTPAAWDSVDGTNGTIGNRGTVNNGMAGRIGNAGFVRSAVDTATRQQIEGYLAHFAGIQATNLPSDHPYKTTAPVIIAP